ncbi:MAG: hypothetical protein DI603_13930 [Roseateles depolymerans]|uniref:Signal transduction histidine kinase internal region domain-containing protein n=1 Tax=Roseateles depolymerans TaxID=76731 RepID=A0A2W5DK74_9BURK|nr:MAG: hypothetical protein DI603_13930 [Roseateles depolymerans]
MSALRSVWSAWRSLRREEFAVFFGASLLLGAIDLGSLIEYRVGEQLPQVLARHILLPQLTGLVLLLCWLPVARGSSLGAARLRRIVAVTLLGSALGMGASATLVSSLSWPSMCDIISAQHHKPPCTVFSIAAQLGDTLWVFLPSLLIIGVLELQARRRRQDQAAQALLQEHAELRRRALASRLAALQAQVEPGLLFDALVAVEKAYARQDPDASARLDRLIRHLRIALPRLREAGATLDSETELIASYLDLLRDLGGEPPAFEADLGRGGTTSLPPMLLLPLVQRALQLGRPTRCWLRAGPPLCLGFDQAGLGEEDAELAALRERLAVLGARLVCRSGPGRTEFMLELP